MTASCELVYQGTKVFWKVRNTVDILIVEHLPFGLLEVIGYNPIKHNVAARIFIRNATLIKQIEWETKDTVLPENAAEGNSPPDLYFERYGIETSQLVHFITERLHIHNYNPKSKMFNIELREYVDGTPGHSSALLPSIVPKPSELKPYEVYFPGYSEEIDEAQTLAHKKQFSNKTEQQGHKVINSGQSDDYDSMSVTSHSGEHQLSSDKQVHKPNSTANHTNADAVHTASNTVVQNTTSSPDSAHNTPRTEHNRTKEKLRTLQSTHNTFNQHTSEVVHAKQALHTNYSVASHYSVGSTHLSPLPIPTELTVTNHPTLPPHSHLTPHHEAPLPDDVVRQQQQRKHKKLPIASRVYLAFFGMFKKRNNKIHHSTHVDNTHAINHANLVKHDEFAGQHSPHTPHTPHTHTAHAHGHHAHHNKHSNHAYHAISANSVPLYVPTSMPPSAPANSGIPLHAKVPLNTAAQKPIEN